MRVRSLATTYRDPFMDKMEFLLKEFKCNAEGPVIDNLTVDQTLKALICDAYREPCFRCDERPDTVEVFVVPPELAKFKQSVIVYTLCAECKMDLATREIVTDKLAAQLKEENARMGVE